MLSQLKSFHARQTTLLRDREDQFWEWKEAAEKCKRQLESERATVALLIANKTRLRSALQVLFALDCFVAYKHKGMSCTA